jgi:HK97 family phage portal protein
MPFWNRKPESRSIPAPENQLPLLSAYTATPITPIAALAIGDVWAAVRVLADAVSSLPIHAYRHRGEGRERVTSGKLADLLARPSPGTTQADLCSSLMSHLLIFGNAYIAKYRQAGEVSQLGLLDPQRVRPELENGRLRFRYSPGTGPQQMLTDADVIPIRGLSVDGLVGLSAVSQASRVLGLSDELVKHALSYFDTGAKGGTARPAGILRVPPDTSFAGQERSKEKLRAESRPHGILVVEGGPDGAEYIPIASKLDDSQFIEQRRLAAQEIARVFRIPPHMLGAPSADSMTYSNVEQESIEFVRYSLTPWLRRIELAISNDGDLTFERQFVKFEVDGLLRADAATRSEVYARGLDPITGWLDVDEVRALEDLPPRPPSPMTPTGNGNGTPFAVPVEPRSRQDDVADAIRALVSKPTPPPVVNVDIRNGKRRVTFENGKHAEISEERDGKREVTFSDGSTALLEELDDELVSTNGNGAP